MNLSKPTVVHSFPDPLLVEIEPNEGGIKVVVVGELDLGTAPQLLDALAAYEGSVDDRGSLDDFPPLVIYDLAGVTFLDAAGLRALLTPGIGRVGIVNPSRCVQHILDLLELDLVIPGSGVSNEPIRQPEGIAQNGEGDWVVIALDGEIDLARADELDAIILQQWNPAKNLLVDLVAVTSIDTTGLRSLLSIQAIVLHGGREMRLIIPEGGHVERLLALTGLTSSFTIYRNLDKALERITSGQNLVVSGPDE